MKIYTVAGKTQYIFAGMVIVFLFVLEIFALSKGIDGQMFATVISAITGVTGYAFGKKTSSGGGAEI